jgi:hypothetical protein
MADTALLPQKWNIWRVFLLQRFGIQGGVTQWKWSRL